MIKQAALWATAIGPSFGGPRETSLLQAGLLELGTARVIRLGGRKLSR
jgi:hypothetical protein